MLVGVIADTHGKLPQSVHTAFDGVDHIIHAGDIGASWIVPELQAIAPVSVVRGNNDFDEYYLSDRLVLTLGTFRVMVFHEPKSLRGPVPEGIDVIVHGHTHRSRAERADGVLWVNPGSAGMRGRDGRGPSVALLELSGDQPTAHIIDL